MYEGGWGGVGWGLELTGKRKELNHHTLCGECECILVCMCV